MSNSAIYLYLPLKNHAMVEILCRDLDRGEAEAIVLALELKSKWLLLDERDARKIGKSCSSCLPRLPCEIHVNEERSEFHRGSSGRWYRGLKKIKTPLLLRSGVLVYFLCDLC